jgi:hypothetical protein
METTTRLNEAADNPRSRRVLLAGVVGGLGAWLVSAAQRAMPVEAAAGDPVRIGRRNSGGGGSTELLSRSTQPTLRAVQLGGASGFRAEATSGRAIHATAGLGGIGVSAFSPNNNGVLATTETGIGVHARARRANSIALFGHATGTNAFALVAFGPSQLDGDVTILGRLFVTEPLTFEPTTAPPLPSAGQVRLYARDNGSGKTQLIAQFANGEVQGLATEP